MNLATRNLDPAEMCKLMHSLGWETHFHSGDNSVWSFNKTVDEITLACRLQRDAQGAWTFQYHFLPGVQMMVSLQTAAASFPHPKFERWERRMRDYAHACEAVAQAAHTF